MSSGRAMFGVVELNKQIIERSLLYDTGKIGVRGHTLRSSGQKVVFVGITTRVCAKLGCHSTVASSASTFDIEIETVDNEVTKWSRASVAARLGSEHLPHLGGEIDTISIVGKII